MYLFTISDDTGTPLACAAENGHEVIVDYLLKSGADVDGKFTEGDNDELVVSSYVICSWCMVSRHTVVCRAAQEAGA